MDLIVEKVMLEIIKSIEVRYKELMKHDDLEYCIDYSNYQYLVVISKYDGITQNELAKKMNVLKSSVSKAVKQLSEKELINVIRDKNDGRIKRLSITSKGHNMAEGFKKVIRKLEKDIFRDFSEKEQKEAIRLLFKVFKNIDDKNKDYAKYLESLQ